MMSLLYCDQRRSIHPAFCAPRTPSRSAWRSWSCSVDPPSPSAGCSASITRLPIIAISPIYVQATNMDIVNQVGHFGSKNDFGLLLLCLSCTCCSVVIQTMKMRLEIMGDFFFLFRERCPAGAVLLFTATLLQLAFFRDFLYFRF